MLKNRLFFGLAIISVVAVILAADAYWDLPLLIAGVLLLLVVAAQYETVQLCAAAGVPLWPRSAVVLGVLVFVGRILSLLRNESIPVPILDWIGVSRFLSGFAESQADVMVLGVGLLVASIWADHADKASTRRAFGTFAVVLFVPVSMVSLLALRAAVGGGWVILLMLLASVKLGDMAAYFVGTFAGRHKMAPLTSPNKTWEGAAASLAASVIVALTIGLIGPYSAGWAAGFGLVAGIAGQLGDLAESRIKRDASAKDSASLIPAFGGILDTLDSLIFAGPACYMFFHVSNCFGFLDVNWIKY